MDDITALLGTWRMVSWKREVVATGEQSDAVGPEPIGFINYGADGRFYAIVVGRDRPRPETLPPSDAEKLKLFSTMLAYAGTYTVDDEKAVHHVDASWNEAWTGTDQVRFYKLTGNKLSITGARAPDPYTGQEIIHRIEFQREIAGAGGPQLQSRGPGPARRKAPEPRDRQGTLSRVSDRAP